jgi:hypothetical protein
MLHSRVRDDRQTFYSRVREDPQTSEWSRAAVLVALLATAATLLIVPAARAATVGVWLTPAEIQRLPISGPAWDNVKRSADANLSGMTLMADQNSLHDTSTMAVALVAVRLGNASYRQKAAQEIERAIGSENGSLTSGSRHLPICRNTTAYVIAADLIDLSSLDPVKDVRFRDWIKGLRDNSYDGEQPTRLIYERRSNNHGTMCGAARAAISRYLGDQADLARTAQVLKGWLGDRRSFTFVDYHPGSDTYMPDPLQPRPVNPAGATKSGQIVDGMLPAEHARCGSFSWLPCYTVYPWGGLGGAVVNAEILRRAGYADVFSWESSALLRAYIRLHELAKLDGLWWQEATKGNDRWQPWLVNRIYGTAFPAVSPARPGRNMGWTDWTHATR